ncbi:MAG: ComEC/Rec2 family competence protein [Angelakisella sp.]
MNNRPLVLFGAAFLLTVSAALFAPLFLLPLAAVCAFSLLFVTGKYHRAAVACSLGCLTAILTSGFFFVRLENSRTLVGTVQSVEGSIFYDQGRQMALLTMEDGKRHLAQLFPQVEDVETGDSISGTVLFTKATTDSGNHLLSGGILLSCTPVELTGALPVQNLPLSIRGMLLRQRLCEGLRTVFPATATDVTVALLFSANEYISPSLRSSFQKSGMSHLLAVSGLHLSILVWTLVAWVKRIGGGKWSQAAVGSLATLLIFLAAGMTPSVFRASLMTILTLLAGLLSRKSDGLTSLSVAAVLLVAASPPVITNLSFLLSFSAVAGILLLSSRFSIFLEQLWVSRFSHCGKAARWLLGSISTSMAAQLATAPVVALAFGSLPLLGTVINLIAIPLVYPVLIFGFIACLLLVPFPSAAALLLLPANLCSALLGAVAQACTKLPVCSLPVVFPTDLLPLLLLILPFLLGATLSIKRQHLRLATAVCLVSAAGCAVCNLYLAHNTITIASSSVTGSLIVSGKEGAVIIENAQSRYHRTLDSRLLSQLGQERPILAVTYPYDTTERMEAAAQQHLAEEVHTPQTLFTPVELLPKIWVSVPQPYITEITFGNTKLMKFYATYDTIEELENHTPVGGDILLADRQGNLLSLGGKHYIFRRGNGQSFTRIHR